MLSSKIISLITFLVVIIAVVLSVTSAPVAAPVDVEEAKNETLLQSDSIPVSSDGDGIQIYSEDDAAKIPDAVVEKGNSDKGTGKGL